MLSIKGVNRHLPNNCSPKHLNTNQLVLNHGA
jgi:hypothetical protein